MKKLPANALVVASNKLFELITPLSLAELRLMDFLVAHLDPRVDYSFEAAEQLPPSITASIDDFCTTFDVAPRHAYDRILQAFDKLNQHKIWYELEIGPDSKKVWEVWFRGGSFFRGKFEFYLTPASAPLFLKLKKEFTRYRLSDIHQLKTGVSYKLYKLLKSHQKQAEWQIEIDELKTLLGVEKKYPRWQDFKRWALNKSVDAINKTTDLSVTAQPERQGHAFRIITFLISQKLDDNVIDCVTDEAKLEQLLINAGLHKTTAAKYAAQANDANKIETIAHKLPQIIKRAASKPQAERKKYIAGAVNNEIRQYDLLRDAKVNKEQQTRKEMLQCVKKYITAQSICDKRKRAANDKKYKVRLAKCVLCFADVSNDFFEKKEDKK